MIIYDTIPFSIYIIHSTYTIIHFTYTLYIYHTIIHIYPQWKAHDGLIMKLDWSPVNNLIISGTLCSHVKYVFRFTSGVLYNCEDNVHNLLR